MFIAQKPCTFAGVDYKIGDSIKDGAVLPEAVTRLIRTGVIAEADNAGPLLPAVASIEEPEKLLVPIVVDEGVTTVEMTVEELLGAVHTIQKTDEEIIEDIKKIKNEDVLIFVDVLKGAKENIHEAAAARAEEICPSETAEEEAVKWPTTERALMDLKRDELAECATFYGMTVEEKHTKAMLTEYILNAQRQQGSDE